jgi:hypothetical protein
VLVLSPFSIVTLNSPFAVFVRVTTAGVIEKFLALSVRAPSTISSPDTTPFNVRSSTEVT